MKKGVHAKVAHPGLSEYLFEETFHPSARTRALGQGYPLNSANNGLNLGIRFCKYSRQ